MRRGFSRARTRVTVSSVVCSADSSKSPSHFRKISRVEPLSVAFERVVTAKMTLELESPLRSDALRPIAVDEKTPLGKITSRQCALSGPRSPRVGETLSTESMESDMTTSWREGSSLRSALKPPEAEKSDREGPFLSALQSLARLGHRRSRTSSASASPFWTRLSSAYFTKPMNGMPIASALNGMVGAVSMGPKLSTNWTKSRPFEAGRCSISRSFSPTSLSHTSPASASTRRQIVAPQRSWDESRLTGEANGCEEGGPRAPRRVSSST